MKKTSMALGLIALFSLGYAAEQAQWPAPFRAFKGRYAIYSGELDDLQAPTAKDRKLSFVVEGQAAKDIFNAMPPDEKQACSGEKGDRSRRKKHVWCTYHSQDGYTCYFGFDLQTGRSITGGIC